MHIRKQDAGQVLRERAICKQARTKETTVSDTPLHTTIEHEESSRSDQVRVNSVFSYFGRCTPKATGILLHEAGFT